MALSDPPTSWMQQEVESTARGHWYLPWKASPTLTRRNREVQAIDMGNMMFMQRSGPTLVSGSGRQCIFATGRRLALLHKCSMYITVLYFDSRFSACCYAARDMICLIAWAVLGMIGCAGNNFPILAEVLSRGGNCGRSSCCRLSRQ